MGAEVTTGDELEAGPDVAAAAERAFGRGGGAGAALGDERATGYGSGTGGVGAGVANAWDGGGPTTVFSPGSSSGSAVMAMARACI